MESISALLTHLTNYFLRVLIMAGRMMYVLKKSLSTKRKVMSLLEEDVLDKLKRSKCTAAVKRSYGVNQFQSGPRLGNGFVLRPQK
jgi:hypothetical protein